MLPVPQNSHPDDLIQSHVLLLFSPKSCLTLCDPHGLWPARLICPPLSPGVCSDSYPWRRWCYLTILSSATPLFLPSAFPASGSFLVSQLCIRWPKYWSFSFSSSPSNEYLGLIFFRIDWFDIAVQRTLKGLLQHHSLKTSVLLCSAFFIVQLSRPYMTTGKTIALTRRTFVGKVMSLLFNTLSGFVLTFLPRSKYRLISCCSHRLQWFWSPRK